MRVNIKQFTNALAKISAFVNGEKNVIGVLLDIKNNSVDVCYSDGKRSVIERLDAVMNSNDRQEQIVLNYQRLVDIVDICQSSGRIVTDSIEIIFESVNTIKFRTKKKILEKETSKSKGEYRICSVIEQSMNWTKTDADLKLQLLSRMNYDDIFKATNSDEWQIKQIREILGKISTEKNKIVYVSPKKENAFVCNQYYISCLSISSGYKNPMVLTSAVARSIYKILGKISAEQEKVVVHIMDKKFCCIHTKDKKVGIWVEMAEAKQIHLDALKRYEDKKYRNYQLTFIKEVLKNVIDSAIAADKDEKAVLKFGTSKFVEGIKELKIECRNAGASIYNDYAVVCEKCLDAKGDIDNLELPISLKVLSDMINKCDNDYIGIDIDVDETDTRYIYIRVSDIDSTLQTQVISKVKEKLDLAVDKPVPLNEQLDYRADTLIGKHYTILAK